MEMSICSKILIAIAPPATDGDLTVAQYTAKVAKDLGGEIKIVKFARFVKGEGLEKRADDFASEVASMVK